MHGDDRLWPRGGAEAAPTGAAVLAVGPVIARADVNALCEQLVALVRGTDAAVVVCDVSAITDPDAVTVDAVARLKLTALRLGRRVRLHGACGRLQDLLALTGLSGVLPSDPALHLDPRCQAEQREQALGVQEGVEPGDAAG